MASGRPDIGPPLVLYSCDNHVAERFTRQPRQFLDGTLTAKSLGHLFVINFGHGVLAANALDLARQDQAVLWPRNYAELLDSAGPRQRQMRSRDERNAWGDMQPDIHGRRVHSIGPVEEQGIVYLQGNSLYCVDPLRGEEVLAEVGPTHFIDPEGARLRV